MNKLGFKFPTAAFMHGQYRPRAIKLKNWLPEEDGAKEVQFYTIKLQHPGLKGLRAKMVVEEDPE